MAEIHGSGKRHLPILLDLGEKLIVIFGGGAVGERKARRFLDYGNVRVVSQDFSPGLLGLKDRLDLVAADLSKGFSKYLDGAFIAIPATSDLELNRSIELEASRQGILINKVDGVGDVVLPSIIKKGTITIAISTENPGLTKYLRLALEKELTENYQEMALLLAKIRPELKSLVPLQKDRARIIWNILEDEEVWRLLEVSREKAYDLALEHRADYRESNDI
jgi:precorrin-2 dehydrogenase/sirohydrochlorin ferrochelatase